MVTNRETRAQEDHEAAADERAMFGFWVYLMTDLLMFAVLFAVYAVLHDRMVGSQSGRQLFILPLALAETVILLTSSFTCGVAMIAARQRNKLQALVWLAITFALGLSFLGLELREFTSLIRDGHTWGSNAFLSSFFVLLGTHGLHIISGLLWMAIVMVYAVKRGLTDSIVRKLTMLSLFWHFLDIVWIFIFTIVYLRAFV